MHHKTIGLTVLGVVLAGGWSFAAAGPAAAAQGTRPCPSHDYCFYNNADYGTNPGVNNPKQANWHLNYRDTTGGAFDDPPHSSGGNRRDQLSSVINNGNRTICIWNVKDDQASLLVAVHPYEDINYLGGSNDMADTWSVRSGNVRC